MPAVELLKPRSLTAYGRRWERGVKVSVTNESADLLEDDARFAVRRSQKAEEEVSDQVPYAINHGSARPVIRKASEVAGDDVDEDEPLDTAPVTVDKGLAAKIREAADDVDIENDLNFDSNGRPTAAAISAVMGEEITAEQVAAALDVSENAKQIAAAAAGNKDMADEQKALREAGETRPRGVKIKNAKAAKQPDPTTDVVVEV